MKQQYIATVAVMHARLTFVTKSWHDFHKNVKINWEYSPKVGPACLIAVNWYKASINNLEGTPLKPKHPLSQKYNCRMLVVSQNWWNMN